MRAKLTLIIAALALVMLPARATSKPQPLTFGWEYAPVRQSPVEQYLPTSVTNTTSCAWDIDDNSSARGDGYLNAGGSASWTTCQIFESYSSPSSTCITDFANARGCGRPIGANVLSSSPSLQVALCFSPGSCFNPAPVYNPTYHAYQYTACVRAVYPYGSPLDMPVGNEGGHGVVTNVVLSVTNPTRKQVSGNTAWLQQIGWYQGPGGGGPVYYGASAYCYYDNVDTKTDGTFRWTLSG